MGKSILNDAQQIQLMDFCKQEKTARFILDFFKTNYQLDLPGHVVYAAKTRLKKIAAGGYVQHKKYQRSTKDAGEDIVTIAREIAALPKQIEEIYLKVFKRQRKDLIAALARAQKIYGEPEDTES